MTLLSGLALELQPVRNRAQRGARAPLIAPGSEWRCSALRRPPMPVRTPRPTPGLPASRPWVVKLQILAAVFVPMVGLGLWLRSQGFW